MSEKQIGINSHDDDIPHRYAVENKSDEGLIVVLRQAFRSIKAHKYPLTLWTACTTIFALWFAFTSPVMYSATSTLLLESTRAAPVVGRDSASAPQLDLTRADSELQVIKSERLLAKVFAALNVSSRDEFNLESNTSKNNFKDQISLLFPKSYLSTQKDAEEIKNVLRQRAFSRFSDFVSVRRIGQSYVIEITYTSTDPTFARQVSNAIASAYLWQSVSFKAEAAKNGGEFIQSRVNSLSGQVKAVSDAVAAGSVPLNDIPDADGRIIGSALQPLSPSAPKKGLIVVLGFFAGIFSGILFVTLKSTFDRRIYIEAAPNFDGRFAFLPLDINFGSRRRRRQESSMVFLRELIDNPNSNFARQIRFIQSNIWLSCGLPDNSLKPVISLIPFDRTATSFYLGMNLARRIHELGYPVALVDFSLSQEHDFYFQEPWKSAATLNRLVEILESGGELVFNEIDGINLIRASTLETDDRLCLGGRDYSLHSSAVKSFIDILSKKYIVIINSKPSAILDEAQATVVNSDCSVLVIRSAAVTFDEIDAFVASLKVHAKKVVLIAAARK